MMFKPGLWKWFSSVKLESKNKEKDWGSTCVHEHSAAHPALKTFAKSSSRRQLRAEGQHSPSQGLTHPLEPVVVQHLAGSWPDPRHSEGRRDEHGWVHTQAEPRPGAPRASPARNVVPPAQAALNPQLWAAASLLLLVPPNPAHPLWSLTPKAAEAGQGRQPLQWSRSGKSQPRVPACSSGRRKADGHHLHLTNLALVSLQP